VLPREIFYSGYVDERMLVPMLVIFALALPERTVRQGRVIAMTALVLFSVRIAEISVGWRQQAHMVERELAALDHIPRGSRIAAFAVYGNAVFLAPLNRLSHLPNFAILRKEAFTNTQWDVPNGQMMRPVYNRAWGFNGSGSSTMNSGQPNDRWPTLAKRIDSLPRGRFDFVWVFDRAIDRPWLRLVFRGPHGRLYRIRPEPARCEGCPRRPLARF
jgi:hypothetical protein